MKLKVFLYCFFLSIFTSCITDLESPLQTTENMPPIINENNWNVIWEDDFNNIDTISCWGIIPKGKDAWDKFMSTNSECYKNYNGELVLKGLINKRSLNKEFITGGLWTKGKKNILYGKVEIRAKFNKVDGAWPAIWMISDEKTWPNGGEIDILETINWKNTVNQTIHTPYTLNKNNGSIINHLEVPIKDKTQYNIYGVIVNKDEIIFTINGRKTFTYPNLEPTFEEQFPFNNKKFLILSMQLDYYSMTGKNVDEKQLPAEMIIDWVRFYEKIDESLPDYEK